MLLVQIRCLEMKKHLIFHNVTEANEHLSFSLVILVTSFPFVADHGASGGITKGKIKDFEGFYSL